MIGNPPRPGSGIGMQDGKWLNGLAGGNNRWCQSGLVALAGGAQAASPIIGGANAQGIEPALIRFTTVATANDSTQLINAIAGKTLLIHNAGAAALAVFASPTVNKATGVVDVINALANGTALAVPAGKIGLFFCALDGFWSGSPLP